MIDRRGNTLSQSLSLLDCTQTGQWISGDQQASLQGGKRRVIGRLVWRVLVSILAWTAIGWIFSLADLNSGHYEYSLRVNLLEFSAWGFLAPLVLALDRRLPFSGKQLGIEGRCTSGCEPPLDIGLSLHLHDDACPFGRCAMECAAHFATLRPREPWLVSVELAHLLSNRGRGTRLPILRALHFERAAC